ncbi:MAG TPA: methylated-DNA--[protein]-cysteine S-methyltransferase [Stellaceae bacterium]|nr:methylated-DNA--[protein]-cysteine S-methyltransferase [Stellaceae bacterium]
MMLPGWGGVMGRNYAIFDTGIGRSGIVWSDAGIVGVQLPEAREIETRRRLFRLYPEGREQRPPPMVGLAIEGIVALLRGKASDFSDITLDMEGVPTFNQRVYEHTRTIPRGETRTYGEVAAALRRTGGERSVAQAIAKNPFMIIVPCHRVLETGHYADKNSPFGGTISKRHLLSVEGTRPIASKTLFDVLLPVAPSRPHN